MHELHEHVNMSLTCSKMLKTESGDDTVFQQTTEMKSHTVTTRLIHKLAHFIISVSGELISEGKYAF